MQSVRRTSDAAGGHGGARRPGDAADGAHSHLPFSFSLCSHYFIATSLQHATPQCKHQGLEPTLRRDGACLPC